MPTKCARCGVASEMDLCDSCERFERDNVSDKDIERLTAMAAKAGLILSVKRTEYHFKRPGKKVGAIQYNFDKAVAFVQGYGLHSKD